LHTNLENQIDLRRLARVFRWIDPQLDENAVFQRIRRGLFELAVKHKKWVQSLPQAVSVPKSGVKAKINLVAAAAQIRRISSAGDLRATASALPGLITRTVRSVATESHPDDVTVILQRLPECLALIEQMIENFDRLKMYKIEIQAIKSLGLRFRDWMDFGRVAQDQGNHRVLYIVLSEAEAHAA
jgi:hypothetical protein